MRLQYLTKEETRNTSKICHRCGHVAQISVGRIYKCPTCGMEYDRGFKCVSIVKIRSAGWGELGF
ncbi:MAG: transposase [Archaeoglobales archaeon]|nr:transposase [Archaeoglobales archaeon]